MILSRYLYIIFGTLSFPMWAGRRGCSLVWTREGATAKTDDDDDDGASRSVVASTVMDGTSAEQPGARTLSSFTRVTSMI